MEYSCYYFVIIAFLTIIIILIIYKQNNNYLYDEDDDDVETIMYTSTETSRPLDTIRDVALYTKKKPTFISLNQTTAYDYNTIYHIGSVTSSLYNNFTTGINKLTNNNPGYVGGYQELQFYYNYLAADSCNYIIQDYKIYNGQNNNTLICLKLLNKSSNKILYLFNYIILVSDNYFSSTYYRSLYITFTFIQSIINNDSFMFISYTNLMGWEDVAHYVFGDTVYCSGDLKLPTINDDKRLGAPDAIIISTNYCTKIELHITFLPFTFNKQHFLLYAKLYKNTPNIGFYISKQNKQMLLYYIQNIKNNNYLNPYQSNWNPENDAVGDYITYWSEIDITISKPLISLENFLNN